MKSLPKKVVPIAMLAAAGAQSPPQIDLATLESYAGSYKGEHGIGAEITVKDGRLFAMPVGQENDESVAVGPVHF